MDTDRLSAISNWLISGAPPHTDSNAPIAELAQRLVDSGVGLEMLGVYALAINPLARGRVITWTPRSGVRRQDWTHDMMSSPEFVGSIAEACVFGKRLIRYRIGANPTFDQNEGSLPLIRRGYTEFLAIPLIGMHGNNGVFGVATTRNEGFTEEEVPALRQIAAPLARIVEAQTQQENMQVLLATYVGEDASARVLAGQVRRGGAEVIPAVILFADLVGFTKLSNTETPEVAIRVLNQFFAAMDASIRKHGGEVLKLIGDGLLAIFPTPDDLTAQQAAAANALLALEEANESFRNTSIDFRGGLNLGDIHYGNIGSESRLDFTAIGPAVNLTSRVLATADELGENFVCTEMFSRLLPERAALKGSFEFKGFADAQPVYSLEI
jgi:adenylate cyclase